MTSKLRARQTDPSPNGIDVAQKLFADIAALSADTTGVSRPAFSSQETKTLEYLEHFARQNGLSVQYDSGQNAVFCLPEHQQAKRYMLLGSHVDTVPNGGNFDGLAGVIAGLLCLLRAKEQRQAFVRPVKVVALRGEESAWFGPCYVSSKALLGRLDASELEAPHRSDGRQLAEHMADVGVDMARVRRHLPLIDPESIEGYIELHIEQGPLLVEKHLPAAVVSGIRGNIRHKCIRCLGEPGHSGAVPRAYRKDPVFALAELISRLDGGWSELLQQGQDVVVTSGIVATDPRNHALTRIPDLVEFSLDIRSQSADTLRRTRTLLEKEMHAVAQLRGVVFRRDDELYTPPAFCDGNLVDGLKEAMSRVGQQPFAMSSGGGHDAAVFANAGIPSAMVFVRNRNGSHNPDEAMELADLVAGIDIIFSYLTEAVH